MPEKELENQFIFRWIPIEEAPPPIGLEVLLELKYIGSQFARFYSVGINQGDIIEHQFIATEEKHFDDYKVIKWKLIN